MKTKGRFQDIISVRLISKKINETTPSLRRVLRFPSLLAIAVGAVTAQSSFVTLLKAAGMGRGSFLVAILIAFVLTLCYVFTYLELSLMMPRAGGPGTYAAVAVGPFISIGLVLGGYVAMSAIANTAELTLLQRIVDTVYPRTFSHLAVILLTVIAVLNLTGINIFASAQNIIVYSFVVAALVIGVTGSSKNDNTVLSLQTIGEQILSTNTSVFSLVILAIWSFAGLEFLCPMAEETKRPQRSIPAAMLLGAIMLLIIYGLAAFAGMRHVPAENLATSEIPHWLLVKSLFGNSAGVVMVVFAFTATSATVNAGGVATISRMLYGMAHHRQLPGIFKSVHPRWKTPWFAILFLYAIIAVPLILLADKKDIIELMLISASSLWVLAYIVAHFNLIILRKKYPAFQRPFKTPLYPIPQVIGIVGMGYFLLHLPTDKAWQAYVTAGLIFLCISVYSFFWVRYKMKKGLFEAEPINQAIAD
jgi:amino acid transporter